MKNLMLLGTNENGSPFTLPEQALVQTFAAIGIRGSGKTTAVAVMCEEFCKLGLPWIMLDPPGVGWGLRAGKDGKPTGGHPIVVFGGEHGDLPIAKDQGSAIAEAIVQTNISAVIDLKNESKTTWRKFITDFCLKLLEMTVSQPRHIFIEEAGELVPQKAKFQITAACKEAVERLVRLGRNNGYGCTLINQRPATVDKDVLSQCENLLMLRTISTQDRKALLDWLEPNFPDKADGRKLVNQLASLPDGMAYFWSPNWLRIFSKVKIRNRETFHPGATRTDMRSAAGKPAEMADVTSFVSMMSKLLSKKSVTVKEHAPSKSKVRETAPAPTPAPVVPAISQEDLDKLDEEISQLNSENATLQSKLAAVAGKLVKVRELLKPYYETLKSVMETAAVSTDDSFPDPVKWAPWLERASKIGCKRSIQILIEKGKMTQRQLSTLSGVSPRTWKNYRAWMNSNRIVVLDGDWPDGTIELVKL